MASLTSPSFCVKSPSLVWLVVKDQWHSVRTMELRSTQDIWDGEGENKNSSKTQRYPLLWVKQTNHPILKNMKIYSTPVQHRWRLSSHLICSWRLGGKVQISVRLGLCGIHVETIWKGPRFLSMFLWGPYLCGSHICVENILPLLNSEQHWSLFAWWTP